MLHKLFFDYTEEEKARGLQLFLIEYQDREDAQAIWDRMNGNRIHYYWDAHVERLESEQVDHGGWEDH
ncbi:hypothetical protein SEA_ZOOMAN_176 [Microbacterium phage Zooman]|nr:hypothetical protein SEA_ZOOMAN_176 [Microbacterium phage Zooman]